MPSPSTIWTIGHGARPIEVFLELLSQSRVELVVDIRSFPGSRRNPQYNSTALSESLRGAGVAYLHEPRLGGRRHSAGELSVNAGWRNPHFRAYADHMGSFEFESALKELIGLSGTRRISLLCAESFPSRCHRLLVSDALLAQGVKVLHITDRGILPHRLTPFARIEGGRVTYPKTT